MSHHKLNQGSVLFPMRLRQEGVPARKRHFWGESLCLSRACLGKRIIFIEKLDKKAVFAAHLMMSGTRTPASQFVNFCHWPCSPDARKPETKTAFFSDASFSHEKRRRFAKTCSGEGGTQKRRVGNKTKRSGARVCVLSQQASKQASKQAPRFQP